MHTLKQITLFKAASKNEFKKVTISLYLHKLDKRLRFLINDTTQWYLSTMEAPNQQIYNKEKL